MAEFDEAALAAQGGTTPMGNEAEESFPLPLRPNMQGDLAEDSNHQREFATWAAENPGLWPELSREDAYDRYLQAVTSWILAQAEDDEAGDEGCTHA